MSVLVDSIALGPLFVCGVGQGGNVSARSSVKVDLCNICNPVTATLQVLPTSGFYAESTHAVSDVLSTLSGKCLKLKTAPTDVRIRSQLCAELSLRAAALVSKDIATVAQSSSSMIPWLARFRSRLFSSTRVSGSIDRGWLAPIDV